MKKTFSTILLVFALLFYFKPIAQNTVTKEDLKTLIGEWTGSLTYIDYRSNKPYTMPANLRVEAGKNDFQLLLFNIYPNEPKANDRSKIKISKNGDKLDNHPVKSREELTDGQIQLTTEYAGKDNNKNALIRNIYIIGERQFVIRKEVKFENSDDWLMRNEFNYKR